MSYPADSPSIPASPETSGQKLRSTQPLDVWRCSITTFAGFTGTRPSAEHLNISFGEATKIFCPKEAVVLADKAQGTYFITCELKDAELVGTTREWAIKNGQPTVGKMRAKPHVTASTLVVVDVDGMQLAGFNDSLQMLEKHDITHLAYTTHSHGREDKPGVRARIVIPVDRALTPDEYTIAWFGFDQFFLGGQAGKADPSGARLHQQQGIHCCHPDRTDQAVVWMHGGGVAYAEALLEIGRQVDRVKLITLSAVTASNKPSEYTEVDYPYSDADKIARNCHQIQQMRDTKGADQIEPLWNASIGAVVHCHNGYQKIHDWSSGHEGYSVVATDKKIAHREKIPPSTCHQFRQINPEGCEGCNRQCGSPFSLGYEDAFEVVEGCEVEEQAADTQKDRVSATQSVDSPETSQDNIYSGGTALDKFSLRNKLEQLESMALVVFIMLGRLILLGQFVFIYAAANTGKTLLMIHLLVEAIGKGIIDPSKVYYINMDDNSNGILDKLRIAEELGFHILADGMEEFSVAMFMHVLNEMIENGQAHGVVLVLDTYKKFANTMDKTQSRAFNTLLRRFVMAGGTVIALAHVNKNPGPDGRARYAGTSDSLDDCDCAYMLTTVSNEDGYKTVEFLNIKNRGGGVTDRAAYRYCSAPDQSYAALLGSVQPVESHELDQLKAAEVVKSDSEVIAAVQDCIRNGIATKMQLAAAVAQRTGVSRKSAIEVIEKYCGDDPATHRWRFRVRGRGAKVFEVIEPAMAYTFEDGGT